MIENDVVDPGVAVDGAEASDFPSSWRAEDRAHWDSAPAELRQIVRAREDNWAKESGKYRDAHDNWSRLGPVIDRFKPLFQAEGVDAHRGIENVLQLAHNLRYGDAGTKQKILEQLQGFYSPGPAKEYLDPDVGELRKELSAQIAELKQGLTGVQQGFHGYMDADTKRTIDAFAKDPSRTHFSKVSAMMGKLISGGLADNLEGAYDMALKLNGLASPAAAEVKQAQSRQAMGAARLNVKSNGQAQQDKRPQQSLRKSLEKAYDRIPS